MKFLSKISIAALMTATTQAAGGSTPYSYLLNGADWPFYKGSGDGAWYCHLQNQSPIDLRTDMHSDPFPKEDGNEFKGTYNDITGATVKNLGKVVQMNFPDVEAGLSDIGSASPNNYYESGYAKDKLKAASKFNAAQFHFHAKSEHTINGQRFDLEMHTVHFAKNDGTEGDDDIKKFASATGIIFDTKNYDPTVTAEERMIIDKFFDALNFEKTPPTTDWSVAGTTVELTTGASIPYGQLKGIMKPANRWVYTGSLTTPPCNIGVLFNIFERVLPISQKHFDAYVAHQATYPQKYFNQPDGTVNSKAGVSTDTWGKLVTVRNLDVTGNWRVTQIVDNHNVKYMRADFKSEEETDPETTTIILAVLLGVSVLIAIILGICACKQMQAKVSAPLSAEQLAEEAAEGGQPEQSEELELKAYQQEVQN